MAKVARGAIVRTTAVALRVPGLSTPRRVAWSVLGRWHRRASRRCKHGCRHGQPGSRPWGLASRRRCGHPRRGRPTRAWACSRATETSMCIACASGLVSSSCCIQTVDPRPRPSTALSCAAPAYPRTARQKARSTSAGRAAMASCTSCVRDGPRPRRAAARLPRCLERGRHGGARAAQTSRVNRTVTWSSPRVSSTPSPRRRGSCATAPARRAASPQGRNPEHRGRPSVQHHPIPDVVGGEERLPTLFAHVHLRVGTPIQTPR